VLIAADAGDVVTDIARRSWLIIGERTELTAAICDELAGAGDECRVVDGVEREVAGTATYSATGIVLLADPAGTRDPVQRGLENANRLTALLQSVAQSASSAPARVWVVTEGAQDVDGSAPVQAGQAALWGLAPTVALELPDVWGGIIDLDPADAPRAKARDIAVEITHGGSEDRVAFRSGVRVVPRLVQQSVPASPTFRPAGGSWLITGGLGAVGMVTAAWLVRQGGRHLVLLGRTGAQIDLVDANVNARLDQIRALRAQGARVEVVEADVADEAAVARVMTRFGREWPVLEGIVHAAGTFGRVAITDATAADFESLFGAKGRGAVHLARHASPTLKHFVLCSSTAALLGGIGQAPYAAANAVMDALACTWRADGRRVVSVNWGLWSAMRGVTDAMRRHYAAMGLREMPPDAALEMLAQVVASDRAQCAIAAFDLGRLVAAFGSRRSQPFLSRASAPAESDSMRSSTAAPGLLQRLARAEVGARLGLALECVTARIAGILRLPSASHVLPERGLFEMGMDSLMSVELKQQLQSEVGQPLPATLTFNHPSATALAAYLVGLVPAPPGERHDARAPTSTPVELTDGMSEDELISALTRQLEELS
jgi:myxalamid-type polyketide synthase MxaE and MxaD